MFIDSLNFYLLWILGLNNYFYLFFENLYWGVPAIDTLLIIILLESSSFICLSLRLTIIICWIDFPTKAVVFGPALWLKFLILNCFCSCFYVLLARQYFSELKVWRSWWMDLTLSLPDGAATLVFWVFETWRCSVWAETVSFYRGQLIIISFILIRNLTNLIHT